MCAPFVITLLKRSGEAKIDIALMHLCDFRHCVPALLDRRLCDKIGLNTGTWYIVFSMCYDVVDVLCVSCPGAIEFSAILFLLLARKAQTHIDHWKVLDKLWCQISFKSDNG